MTGHRTRFPPTLALATKNRGKIREILEICSDWPVTWIVAADGDLTAGDVVRRAAGASWPEVEETGEGYLENALLKARAVAAHLEVPALADDSGIEVDALGGEPGPRSARFAGEGAGDEENRDLLVERLGEVAPPDRTARYRCVAVCAWQDGRTLSAEGTCEGRLILDPRGSGGFGYDPLFVPAGEDLTMAELSPEEKNRISHRGKAFRALRHSFGEGV